MELLQLQYFMVTSHYQHMTKSAAILHIAQPALSQSIKRLETDLGVKLFKRNGRNIMLTEEGLFLREKLIPIMKALDEIPKELSDASKSFSKTIRLNILSASELITKVILSYKGKHPDVNFQLSQKIDEKDWDIRISTANPNKTRHEIISHIILREEIFLAVPVNSPFAKSTSVSLAEMKNESFITLEKNKPFSVLTSQYCMSCGFTPKIMFESDNPSTVRDLIASGIGISFWPAYSWGKPELDNVKLLHISKPHCFREIFVTQKKEKNLSEIKNDFYDFLLEYLDANI